jgi:type IV secretion system protein VirB10
MVKRALLAVLFVTVGISLAHADTLAETDSVPAGTLLHCRTTQTLTTRLNVQGEAFTINLAEPVSVNGRVVVPVGSTLAGRITFMERPGRIKGVGQMRLTVEQITLPDGRSFPLGATLMTAFGPAKMKVVGSEGLLKGPNSHKADLEEIGAGTSGGALLGLICGHPVIGATVGFTATTIDRMRRRGKDLTIPVGTQLNYQLTRELDLGNSAPQTTAANQVHTAAE